MRVLIVEDNAFNAFCLSRLFETTYSPVRVTVVNNSAAAMNQIERNKPALVIMDGDLGACVPYCNGPVLTDILWQKYPDLPVVAWTDCDAMRSAFAAVFKRHDKHFNEFNNWSKSVGVGQIQRSLVYFDEDFAQSTATKSNRYVTSAHKHPLSFPSQFAEDCVRQNG